MTISSNVVGAHARNPLTTANAPRNLRRQAARILIVDDSPEVVQILTSVLQSVGYGVVASITDPRGAVQVFERFRPDLLVLDLSMPHLSGFDVMRALNDLVPRDQQCPILVLSGETDPSAKSLALASGAKDFLQKPVTMQEFLRRVDYHLAACGGWLEA